MEPSADALREAGFEVETVTCQGVGHAIDEHGLPPAIAFIATRFFNENSRLSCCRWTIHAELTRSVGINMRKGIALAAID